MSSHQPFDNGYAQPVNPAMLDTMAHDLGLFRREHVSTTEIPDRIRRSASTRQVDRIKEDMEKKRGVDVKREEETKAWACKRTC
jgi:hypothetical protein